MQPCFSIKVLTLEAQILIDLFDRQSFYRAPRAIRRLPNNLTLAISQLKRRSNLIRICAAVRDVVLVDQRGQANGPVVLVATL